MVCAPDTVDSSKCRKLVLRIVVMRAQPFFLGIAILALGLLLVFFGTQTVTIDVPKTQTEVLFDRSTLTVGDVAHRSAELNENLTVICSGIVRIPSSNDSGDISFYVMNSADFQKWESGDRNIDFIVQRLRVDRIEASFVTSQKDTYYFVFDNSHSTLFKKEVTFSAYYEFTSMEHQTLEDRTFNTYGYPLIIVGAVVAVYGLVRKHEVRWA